MTLVIPVPYPPKRLASPRNMLSVMMNGGVYEYNRMSMAAVFPGYPFFIGDFCCDRYVPGLLEFRYCP